LGLVTSSGSLGWQFVNHRLTGARVRCELRLALHDDKDPAGTLDALASGSGTELGHAETGVHERVRRAALMTDGAAVLATSYGLATWEGLLTLLKTASPTGLTRHVREAEQSDPRGTRWPRYKTGDDATAAFCRFGGSSSGG